MSVSGFRAQCKQLRWMICLAFAVIFAQGVHLHIHDDNHSHHVATPEHSHPHKPHFAHNAAHSEHHGEAHAELDIIPDGLLKKVSFDPMLATLLLAAILLFLPCLSARVIRRRYDNAPPIRWLTALIPPPRAPPSLR